MPNPDDDALWNMGVTPPGYLTISPDACNFARLFLAEVKKLSPHTSLVASFSWAYRLEKREDFDHREKWQGPFVRLGAIEKFKVPENRCTHVYGIDIIVEIPRDICSAAEQKLICCAPGLKSKFLLL